jgi:hypothetical protein
VTRERTGVSGGGRGERKGEERQLDVHRLFECEVSDRAKMEGLSFSPPLSISDPMVHIKSPIGALI